MPVIFHFFNAFEQARTHNHDEPLFLKNSDELY